jgi:D-alanyl-D-alanine carboxypeptidase
MAPVHSTRLGFALLVALSLLAPVAATAQTGRSLGLSAHSVLLLDAEGRTLYAKSPEEDHAPASLVKLMTLYLAHEDVEAGKVAIEDLAVVSDNASTTRRYRMGLRAGERVPVRVLMEGVAIASANDAATALAEHLDGTEEAFVARMNAKARVFGLAATRFANAHGLPDPAQRSSARDLARLTARLLEDYPEARTMLGGQMFVWNDRVYARQISLFRDPGGVQALKTGFTREAGYNLSVSAWRNGHQFVMILLGAPSRGLSYADAKKLLQYGFVEAGLEAPPSERPRAATKRPGKARARRAGGR